MTMEQNQQNPDVNTFNIRDRETEERPTSGDQENGVEDDESIPVPPDVEPQAQIEEPPGSEGPPVGDVDDSPKQIA